ILAALGVMRGGTQHGMRRSFRPLRIGVMEGGYAYAELVRVAADLIQRQHPVVAVEGGILEALGHNRAAILLCAHCDANHLHAAESATRLGKAVASQELVEEIENAGVQGSTIAAGLSHGPIDIAAVCLGGRAPSVNICAVD